MSLDDRRDGLIASFAWRLPLCNAADLDHLDEVLCRLEHERDLAERYTFFDEPTPNGPATTSKIERKYRRLKSVTIPPAVTVSMDDRDPRDVVGDGAKHAPDGES